MARVRIKPCDRCQEPAEVLYRVKVDASEQWIFVCDRCYPSVSQNNPYYAYGGTWKAHKPR
ncbi:hypothetical protein [Leptolyngbya sp. FACHB-711]|uniref:hypothetical protein n=1 Tax=unclassified Leptolyngbya TaxID=2650499 RepID=UPI001682C1D2|nr:hypothetical protein [Leptolyngbya sp. FACHB-711]MBD1851589.1 hypothetical protein [Cyanobacteria bacterium FACHB-502]MBD2026398.1 hypothetical protein [Leptolyngbya sp. FACHB-711]